MLFAKLFSFFRVGEIPLDPVVINAQVRHEASCDALEEAFRELMAFHAKEKR